MEDHSIESTGRLWVMAGHPAFLHDLRRADIVYATRRDGDEEVAEMHDLVAVRPGRGGTISVFYGLNTLRSIARGARRGARGLVLRVPIDFESDEVELLFCMIESIKGSCCYNDHDLCTPSAN